MPDNPIKDFEHFARDALYAAVGFGVLGLQRAQVCRREVTEKLSQRRAEMGEQARAAGETLRPPLDTLRPHFDALRPQMDALRPQVDAMRPQAEAIGTQLRAAAVALRPQLESLGAGVAGLLKSMDEHSGSVRHEVDARVSEIEEHLPPGARASFAQLRARAAMQEETLRWVLGLLWPESRSSETSGEETAGEESAEEPGPGAPPAME